MVFSCFVAGWPDATIPEQWKDSNHMRLSKSFSGIEMVWRRNHEMLLNVLGCFVQNPGLNFTSMFSIYGICKDSTLPGDLLRCTLVETKWNYTTLKCFWPFKKCLRTGTYSWSEWKYWIAVPVASSVSRGGEEEGPVKTFGSFLKTANMIREEMWGVMGAWITGWRIQSICTNQVIRSFEKAAWADSRHRIRNSKGTAR
jgi:hypothetical protein